MIPGMKACAKMLRNGTATFKSVFGEIQTALDKKYSENLEKNKRDTTSKPEAEYYFYIDGFKNCSRLLLGRGLLPTSCPILVRKVRSMLVDLHRTFDARVLTKEARARSHLLRVLRAVIATSINTQYMD